MVVIFFSWQIALANAMLRLLAFKQMLICADLQTQMLHGTPAKRSCKIQIHTCDLDKSPFFEDVLKSGLQGECFLMWDVALNVA